MLKVNRLLILLGLITLTIISACTSGDSETIQVYVTATPQDQVVMAENSNPSGDNSGDAVIGTGTPDSDAISGTIPPRFTPTPGPTRNATVTPTPSPTATTPAPTTTSVPAAPALPEVPPQSELPVLDMARFGIQIHPMTTREEWDMMLQHTNNLDFNWIKIQLAWEQIEPRPGEYSPLFDMYVQRVQAANFQTQPYKVLLSVAKAPDWARPEGFDPALDGPPADPQHLANFLQAFIQATKPEDNRIAAIEVWNEPNLIREWQGIPMNGQTYMNYFNVAYDAIKSIAPNITVVTAGLAPVCGPPDTVCDRTYLQQMYQGGLANYTDVKVGVHPYSWANPPDSTCCTTERGWADNSVFYFQDTLREYRDIMVASGHADARMWITEFGWGTYDGVGANGNDVAGIPPGAEFFNLINDEQQAQYVIQALDLLQKPPLSDYVEVSILWNLNYAMVGDIAINPLEQAGYSLLDASGYPRLVYQYLFTAQRISPE